jgi:hypothetical protein
LKQPAIAGIFGVNGTESNREQNGIIGGQIWGACPVMTIFRGPLKDIFDDLYASAQSASAGEDISAAFHHHIADIPRTLIEPMRTALAELDKNEALAAAALLDTATRTKALRTVIASSQSSVLKLLGPPKGITCLIDRDPGDFRPMEWTEAGDIDPGILAEIAPALNDANGAWETYYKTPRDFFVVFFRGLFPFLLFAGLSGVLALAAPPSYALFCVIIFCFAAAGIVRAFVTRGQRRTKILKSDEFPFVFLRRLRFGDGRRPVAL